MRTNTNTTNEVKRCSKCKEMAEIKDGKSNCCGAPPVPEDIPYHSRLAVICLTLLSATTIGCSTAPRSVETPAKEVETAESLLSALPDLTPRDESKPFTEYSERATKIISAEYELKQNERELLCYIRDHSLNLIYVDAKSFYENRGGAQIECGGSK